MQYAKINLCLMGGACVGLVSYILYVKEKANTQLPNMQYEHSERERRVLGSSIQFHDAQCSPARKAAPGELIPTDCYGSVGRLEGSKGLAILLAFALPLSHLY